MIWSSLPFQPLLYLQEIRHFALLRLWCQSLPIELFVNGPSYASRTAAMLSQHQGDPGDRSKRHNQSKSIPLLYVVFGKSIPPFIKSIEQLDQLPVNLSTSFPYIACPLSICYFDSSSANNQWQNLVFFFKRINQLPTSGIYGPPDCRWGVAFANQSCEGWEHRTSAVWWQRATARVPWLQRLNSSNGILINCGWRHILMA